MHRDGVKYPLCGQIWTSRIDDGGFHIDYYTLSSLVRTYDMRDNECFPMSGRICVHGVD